MANPGPASVQTAHPQEVLGNQVNRLLARVRSVNLGASGDTAVPIINSQSWVPTTVVISNANSSGANVDVSLVQVGVYPAAAKAGTAVLTAAALTGQNTVAYATVSTSSNPNTTQSGQTLYVNVGGTPVVGAVADVSIYGYDLSGPTV
jgi:hypothetical protein